MRSLAFGSPCSFINQRLSVKATYRQYLDRVAHDLDLASRSSGYEYIPVDVHVPILDIPDLHEPPPHHVLSNAVIQGTFSTDRRNYDQIFSELSASLHGQSRLSAQ